MKALLCGTLALSLATGSAHSVAQSATSLAEPGRTTRGDCASGFFDRLAAAYREDADVAPGEAPPRRAMDAPFSSPPFPSAEWQLGGVEYPIGVPNGNAQYPLEKALACTAFGGWLRDHRIETYGWINPSANLSTSRDTNYPLSYATRPNRVEFNQFLFRVQRVPDTVQTDHVDWGFHIDQLYGYDYHYTAMKGVFSNQLLNHPRPPPDLPGKVYGYDPMIWFVDVYVPGIGQGTVFTAGRYLSLPDIEAQFAPNNYLLTHSILYTVDAYTNVGVLATTKLSDQWTIQLGLHGGDDVAPWKRESRLTAQGCVRFVSSTNDDMLYPCVESYNGKRQTYNNLQEYVLTWGHRFSARVHMLTEAYRIYVIGAPGFKPGQDPAYGIVNYFNIELDPANMLVIRNEFYKDEVGQRTGFATRYSSHTLGMTRWISQDLELRPELRYEHSYDLPAYDGGRKRSQTTVLFDVILHY